MIYRQNNYSANQNSQRSRLLTPRTKVTSPAQILDLDDFCAAFRAGLTGGVFVHQTDVFSPIIIKIGLVITAALFNHFMNCLQDGIVQGLSLIPAELFDGMLGAQPGAKKDVLGNRVAQAGNELVLGQKSLGALFLRERIDEIIEIIKGKPC